MVHAGCRPLFDTRLASLGCLPPPRTLAALEFPFGLSLLAKLCRQFIPELVCKAGGAGLLQGCLLELCRATPHLPGPPSNGSSAPGSSQVIRAALPLGCLVGTRGMPRLELPGSPGLPHLLPGPATLCPPPPPLCVCPQGLRVCLRSWSPPHAVHPQNQSLKSPGRACHSSRVPHHAGATARPPRPCETFCPAGDSR